MNRNRIAFLTGAAVLTALVAVLGLVPQSSSGARRGADGVYRPVQVSVPTFPSVNARAVAQADAANPPAEADEIESSDTWLVRPSTPRGVEINKAVFDGVTPGRAPIPSATGISAGPIKTFKAEFLSGTNIPPDTMGAVGTTHVVVPTNNNMRILDRNGVELMRFSLTSFWTGTTVKGGAVTSAFDPKIMFDRFNNRFIFVVSLNGPGQFSGMGLAVSQTADPTGMWNRFTMASDPTSTASAGHAIDYPSVGHNNKWIVVDENTFNYSGASFTTYYGSQIFVFDKQAPMRIRW